MTLYISELLLGLVTICLLFLAYFKWTYSYWKRRNVPQFEHQRIPFGDANNPWKDLLSPGMQFAKLYRRLKEAGLPKSAGVYALTTPVYIAGDLEMVQNVLIRDFNHFTDRGIYINDSQQINHHLIALEAGPWRNVRPKLSPAFSSGKMRQNYQIVMDVSRKLITEIRSQMLISKVIDLKDLMSSFTIDIIGTSGFGLECKSFQDVHNDFKHFGIKAVQPPPKQAIIDQICFSFQGLSKLLNLKSFTDDTNAFFVNIVKDTIDFREKNNIVRNDFLQLMIELKNSEVMSMDLIVAQCFLFFIASYDTSSTTLTFAILELAHNQEIQDRVREELQNHGDVTYESLMELKYLGQVIDETLRIHPPAPMMNRCVTEDYKIPGSNAILEKGTQVSVPIYAIHHDDDYFPNPEVFDPERFSDQNKGNIKPGSYLPFGAGPRICLGLRYALMQTRLGLAMLLKNFKFTPHPNTTLPVKIKPSFLLNIDGIVNVNVEEV